MITLSTSSQKRATDARRRLSIDSDGESQTRPCNKTDAQAWRTAFQGLAWKLSGQPENAADRLLHAFPAMIAAGWADANDYLSNHKADWDESKICETKKRFDYHFRRGFQIFVPFPPCFLFPPFVPLFPLQPLLPPIIPLTSSVLPLSLPVCLARPRALYAQARVDGAGCATIVQKWINNSYAKLKAGFPLFPKLRR